MRRNSALREGGSSGDVNASSSSTMAASSLPVTKSLDFPDVNSVNKFHPNITSAPPINRKPRYISGCEMKWHNFKLNIFDMVSSSSNTSPSFSPGETTPKLPPKPKNSAFSSHNGKGKRNQFVLFV